MRSPDKVTVSEQVLAYQRAQHPETRRALKAAIIALGSGRGDIRELEEELSGFHRLRVGPHRIVFAIEADGVIRCIFAERRRVVYELFAATLRERIE